MTRNCTLNIHAIKAAATTVKARSTNASPKNRKECTQLLTVSWISKDRFVRGKGAPHIYSTDIVWPFSRTLVYEGNVDFKDAYNSRMLVLIAVNGTKAP